MDYLRIYELKDFCWVLSERELSDVYLRDHCEGFRGEIRYLGFEEFVDCRDDEGPFFVLECSVSGDCPGTAFFLVSRPQWEIAHVFRLFPASEPIWVESFTVHEARFL